MEAGKKRSIDFSERGTMTRVRSGGIDAQDAIGAQLSSTSSGELIPHNARRVEVGTDLEKDHHQRLHGPPRRPITDSDRLAVRHRGRASVDDGMPGEPLSNADFPKVPHGDRRQDRDTTVEKGAGRANVAFRAMGLTALDSEIPTQCA